MSKVKNMAEGVKMVLLMRHLIVVKMAQLVVAMPGKSSLFSPTVTRTQWVALLWDQVLTTGGSKSQCDRAGYHHKKLKR